MIWKQPIYFKVLHFLPLAILEKGLWALSLRHIRRLCGESLKHNITRLHHVGWVKISDVGWVQWKGREKVVIISLCEYLMFISPISRSPGKGKKLLKKKIILFFSAETKLFLFWGKKKKSNVKSSLELKVERWISNFLWGYEIHDFK